MSFAKFRADHAFRRAIAEEKLRKTFKQDQIRVSSVGGCATKVLALALGLVSEDFPFVFGEGGHLLEAAAGKRFRTQFPLVEEQVSVPTSAPGTWTHPDVLEADGIERVPNRATRRAAAQGRVTFRLINGHGVQIKSTKRRAILEYKGALPVGKFGRALPKRAQVDQALLEWYFWRKAGFCLTEAGAKLLGYPETYELYYLAREDFGDTNQSVEIPWDAPLSSLGCYDEETGKQLGSERAAEMAAEFDRRVEMLRWGIVPPRTKAATDYECAYVPKWYDFDGAHPEKPSVCPMYEKCWGRPYTPPETRSGWSRRKVEA